MSKVSIILPSYNYARFLDERIQTLLAQTFRDFELIVTDDASTDNSREVIAQYSHDDRLITEYFDKNSGSAYQRWNDGAARARGDYLLFAGADDTCSPKLLEELVRILDSNSRVQIAYCQSWKIDDAGNRTGCMTEHTKLLDEERWAKDYLVSGQEELLFLLERNTIPNASAALLRRDAFEAIGGFDTTLKLSADWLMWAKLCECGDIAYVAEPLNSFRFHSGSVRHSADRDGSRLEETYRVIGEILQMTDVPEATRGHIFDELVRDWLLALELSPGSLKRHLSIYKRAKPVDSRIVGRALKMMIRLSGGAVLTRLGLPRQLKKKAAPNSKHTFSRS